LHDGLTVREKIEWLGHLTPVVMIIIAHLHEAFLPHDSITVEAALVHLRKVRFFFSRARVCVCRLLTANHDPDAGRRKNKISRTWRTASGVTSSSRTGSTAVPAGASATRPATAATTRTESQGRREIKKVQITCSCIAFSLVILETKRKVGVGEKEREREEEEETKKVRKETSWPPSFLLVGGNVKLEDLDILEVDLVLEVLDFLLELVIGFAELLVSLGLGVLAVIELGGREVDILADTSGEALLEGDLVGVGSLA